MERREEVKVRDGKEYDHLFPKAMLFSITKKKGATVADTIKFIPQVVRETLFHTKMIAGVLKTDTLRETCRNIWDFVYQHIAYRKDEDGKEQVRSPARAWHDRIMGVDCDCYTTFISSILSNLKIRHALRITKYSEDRFQHIYPIVPLPDGSYITMDCVVRGFDYEEPYTEKKDTKMDLEYLNGVSDTTNIDAQDLLGANPQLLETDDLGKLKDLFKKKQGTDPYEEEGGKKNKFKNFLHKAMNFTNKANPATAILRAGVLAAMKINVFKIAQRLKYAYLTDEEAKNKGVDMDKFKKLKQVRTKVEKIFFDAGGKVENLKKAILHGRGNKGKRKDIEGLGDISASDSLAKILGDEIYQSEVVEGLGSLGEPYSATASITAATGVLGAIAALLKSVGNLFPKKTAGSADFENTENATKDTSASDSPSDIADSAIEPSPPEGKSETPAARESEVSSDSSDTGEKNKSVENTSEDSGEKPGFWARNKKWLLPTSIGAGILALSYAGYHLIKKNKKEEPKEKQGERAPHAVSGIPSVKHKQGKIKNNKHKKKAVELL